MAVCLTHVLLGWTATALLMDPGSVAHALLVIVEMVPTVKILMRLRFTLTISFIHTDLIICMPLH